MRFGNRVRPRPRKNIGPPEWVTFIGNYGDCIAALGNLQELLRETGAESAGVLYYGRFEALPAFLCRQLGVRKCVAVIERDRGDYLRLSSLACNYTVPLGAWLPEIASRAGLPPASIQLCHPRSIEDAAIYQPGRLALSDAAREWAAETLPQAGESLLLQPRSLASCRWGDHWPHWKEAIAWLLSESTGPVILCGTDPLADLSDWKKQSVLDLVGQTPTMEHLLALAERCRGLVTTSNALSMWSITQQIPTVVACNAQVRNPAWFFRRWIEAPPNRLVDHHEGLDAFKAAVRTL